MFKLRNRFINTTAMFLAPDLPKEGEEDNRSDAQKARDAVNMNDSTDDSNDNKNKDENNNGSEDEETDKEDIDDDENEEDDEESDEEKDDEVDENKEENKEETAEEKTTRLAQEKEDRKQARIQRKFDKIAGEKTAAEKRVAELEAQLKEKPVAGLTEEEVQRRAEALAATKLTEKQIKDTQDAFEKNCDKLESAATKEDKDFGRKVHEMTKEIGNIPAPIINILADLDNENGGEVLAYLANNVDEAEDLYELVSNERKLDRKLSKLSDKIKEAKKPARRERSNVPAPITPVGGNSRETSTRITGKETQEEFNIKRAKQEEEKRRVRGY